MEETQETIKTRFIDPTSLTKWVRILLYLQVVVALIAITADSMEIQLIEDMQSGFFATDEAMDAAIVANDDRQAVRGGIEVLVSIVSAILILKWIYRANYNARQLGALDMRFTPGWSVGWFFIPVALLWKPYQAMKEIWRASHRPNDWKNVTTYGLVAAWWFVWLISGAVDSAAFRMYARAVELQEILVANQAYVASYVTGLARTFVTLALVNGVFKAQMSHRSRVPE